MKIRGVVVGSLIPSEQNLNRNSVEIMLVFSFLSEADRLLKSLYHITNDTSGAAGIRRCGVPARDQVMVTILMNEAEREEAGWERWSADNRYIIVTLLTSHTQPSSQLTLLLQQEIISIRGFLLSPILPAADTALQPGSWVSCVTVSLQNNISHNSGSNAKLHNCIEQNKITNILFKHLPNTV